MSICGLGRSESAGKIRPGEHHLLADCLVLGLPGAGKTTLVRQMMHVARPKINKRAEELQLFATIGIDLTDIRYHRKSLLVREVGGAMQVLWPKFLPECVTLVFVCDASDTGTLGAVGDHLQSFLAQPALKFVPIVLVLNKWDRVAEQRRSQEQAPEQDPEVDIRAKLGLPDIEARHPGRVLVIRGEIQSLAAAKRLLQVVAENQHGATVPRPTPSVASSKGAVSRRRTEGPTTLTPTPRLSSGPAPLSPGVPPVAP